MIAGREGKFKKIGDYVERMEKDIILLLNEAA